MKNKFDYSYFPSEIKKQEEKDNKDFWFGIILGIVIGAVLLSIMNYITYSL